MSLYRRFDTEGSPSFVMTNTHRRAPIFRSPSTCQLLVRTLYEVRGETQLNLLAFAIMPDHVHLIVATPALPRAVQLLKGRFARAYNVARGGNGSVWQQRYHERTLRSEAALLRALHYVHNNPVVAGLAEAPSDYRWSSACEGFETDLAAYLGLGQAKA